MALARAKGHVRSSDRYRLATFAEGTWLRVRRHDVTRQRFSYESPFALLRWLLGAHQGNWWWSQTRETRGGKVAGV